MCDFPNRSVVMELVSSVLSLTALQLNFFSSAKTGFLS
jgi:hypothetical protein